MNRKELKHIVDCNAKKMIKRLGLEKWQIEFKYGILNSYDNNTTYGGWCTANIKTKRATITLNPRILTTKKRAISTLRHELVHLIVKTFSKYRHMVHELAGVSPSPFTKRELVILNEMFSFAVEEVTYDICRALER